MVRLLWGLCVLSLYPLSLDLCGPERQGGAERKVLSLPSQLKAGR